MKVHIGVNSQTGMVHSVCTTSANVHDVTQAHRLLHGGETRVWGDSGYQGVGRRQENSQRQVKWEIAMRPGKRRQLAQRAGAMGMGQGPVEPRQGLGSMGEPRIETKVGTEVYYQDSGCQVLLKTPACPGELINPKKMTAETSIGRVYWTGFSLQPILASATLARVFSLVPPAPSRSRIPTRAFPVRVPSPARPPRCPPPMRTCWRHWRGTTRSSRSCRWPW